MNFLQKTALPLLAAFALTYSAAVAQTAPAPGPRPQRSPQEMAQRQTAKLSKKLNLTADQSARVQQIFAQRAQDMQALRTQAPAGADRRQLHEQAQASRAKYDEQLRAVLTPAQFGQYTALREEHRHHGRPDGRDGKLKLKDGKLKAKTSQG